MQRRLFSVDSEESTACVCVRVCAYVCVYVCVCVCARQVSSLSWSPDATRLAAAYTSLRFQSSAADLPVQSFVWDVGQSLAGARRIAE